MKFEAANLIGRIRNLRRSLLSKRGNVAIISAFALIPLLLSVGMGIDYTMAARRQAQIDGYADAAALAAVTPTQMTNSSSVAQATALAMFNAQLATVPNVSYVANNISVTATDTTNGTKVTRVVVVSYTAQSANSFAALLGLNTITIGGSSTATSGVAPKTNFYLLLDTSPSMEIAATTTGINTMVSYTPSQGGCAFGCHEVNPAADGLGNPSNVSCVAGNPTYPTSPKQFPTGGEDNYALARCLNVPLRIDLVNAATQNLMDVATTTAVENDTTYLAAIYTMDYSLRSLVATPTDLATAKAAAANINALQVYNQSCVTISNCNNDTDSYLDAGVSGINAIMPNPGNGTNNANDSPQEVLMIVSDGVIDEVYQGGRRMAPINTLVDNCTAIKARGIRIAFLYLTYNPLPTNGFYMGNIAPFQPQIATAAQNCATGDLYFQVSTDGDISAAMAYLFQKAISEAHLLQ
jgi:Flp pilus assembly protein TadG